MASETENEYIEGSIFDMNDEWKPIGLVPTRRSRNRKNIIVDFLFGNHYIFVHYLLRTKSHL